MKHLTDIRSLSFFIRCPQVTFTKLRKQNKMGYAESPCSMIIRRNVNGKRLSFCQSKQSDVHLSISERFVLSPGALSN